MKNKKAQIDSSIILYIIAGLAGVIALVVSGRTEKKVAGFKKGSVVIVLGLIGFFLFAWQFGLLTRIGIPLDPLAAGVPSEPTEPLAAAVIGTEPCSNELLNAGFTNINSLCRCIGFDGTTVTLAGNDAFTGGAVGGSHRYRVNGAGALVVSDAGTFDATPGNLLDILWMNASQDDYFSAISTEIVPCSATKIFTQPLYQNETTAALDIDLFNRDGDKMDGGVNNQTMGASDTKVIKLRWAGTSQTGYPHGATAVFDFNKTAFDDFTIIGASEVGTPNIHSIRTTFDTTRSFHISGPIGIEELEFQIEIKSSALEPVAGIVMSAGINITIYPNNYYIDDDAGGAYAGPAVEDEDNTRTYGNADVVNFFIE